MAGMGRRGQTSPLGMPGAGQDFLGPYIAREMGCMFCCCPVCASPTPRPQKLMSIHFRRRSHSCKQTDQGNTFFISKAVALGDLPHLAGGKLYFTLISSYGSIYLLSSPPHPHVYSSGRCAEWLGRVMFVKVCHILQLIKTLRWLHTLLCPVTARAPTS